jgi:hypothetical protein
MLTLITLAVKAGFLACGVATLAIASVVAGFADAKQAARRAPERQPADEAVQPSGTAFMRGL